MELYQLAIYIKLSQMCKEKNIRHFVLQAMPEGSVRNLLGPTDMPFLTLLKSAFNLIKQTLS
jgi:hypothetical protein